MRLLHYVLFLSTPPTRSHTYIHTTDIGTHTHGLGRRHSQENERRERKRKKRATMMMTTTRSPPPQCVRERVQSGMSFLSLFPDWWIPSEPATLWPVSLSLGPAGDAKRSDNSSIDHFDSHLLYSISGIVPRKNESILLTNGEMCLFCVNTNLWSVYVIWNVIFHPAPQTILFSGCFACAHNLWRQLAQEETDEFERLSRYATGLTQPVLIAPWYIQTYKLTIFI